MPLCTAISRVLIGTILVAGVSGAQPQFDVATVKLSPPPEGDRLAINLGRILNGKVTLTNAGLGDCIKFAYGIVADAQLMAPDWIKSKDPHYDVVAQAPPETPREQLLLMLQVLLAERFKLKLHSEQRDLPFLALTVGALTKGGTGSKLRPSTAGEGQANGVQIAGRIAAPRMSMAVLTTLLSRFERQTVLDKTGLEGFFDVRLEWTPETLRALPAGPDGAPPRINGEPVDVAGPSLFTAIQEQLGLRLESRKGPVEVLVVDNAEKTPAEN